MVVITLLATIAGFSNAYMNKKRGKDWVGSLITGIICGVWFLTLL